MEERPQNADAVLTLRSRAKANVKLRSAAKTASVPVYAIRSVSNANLIKAFRTLLGVDPAPGNVFKKAGGSRGGDDGGSGAASPKGPDGRRAALFGSMDSESASIDGDEDDEDADSAVREGGYEAAEGEEDESEDEAEAAAVGQAASGGGGAAVSSSYKSQEEREGLEEAQLAVEQIVIPLRQPVELLSRSAAVRDAQAAMISRYRLGVEVVGAGEDARLRVAECIPVAAAMAPKVGEKGPAKKGPAKKAADGKAKKKKVSKAETYKIYIYSSRGSWGVYVRARGAALAVRMDAASPCDLGASRAHALEAATAAGAPSNCGSRAAQRAAQ
ncbi:hypothetical protein MNEG_13632 [Monoraphidium neglectum]|uniref:Phosphotyrosine protein phosphatase domain-containing protein n=1 Tax=Monoraphidium neglectum TaxID=145388 RepID=A0A0D2MH00_9CHLO|nr:hypothetical protein MNEG_13632 [Monoraphidium neglectum]KIY94330.1 hypothetical protein MNEG_13632 [Monoraphidium neglectum]|eukprot:XP_013893350.1 hypothetical protein MNEG_13632 [Monoraphidium neglectum]